MASKAKKDYLIPFAEYPHHAGDKPTWHLMDWVSVEEGVTKKENPRAYRCPDEWRKSEPFFAELILDGWGKGRSAVRFYVINTDNMERYSFGQAGFYEAVLHCGVRNKTLCGKWKFKKQGENYCLVMANDE